MPGGSAWQGLNDGSLPPTREEALELKEAAFSSPGLTKWMKRNEAPGWLGDVRWPGEMVIQETRSSSPGSSTSALEPVPFLFGPDGAYFAPAAKWSSEIGWSSAQKFPAPLNGQRDEAGLHLGREGWRAPVPRLGQVCELPGLRFGLGSMRPSPATFPSLHPIRQLPPKVPRPRGAQAREHPPWF